MNPSVQKRTSAHVILLRQGPGLLLRIQPLVGSAAGIELGLRPGLAACALKGVLALLLFLDRGAARGFARFDLLLLRLLYRRGAVLVAGGVTRYYDRAEDDGHRCDGAGQLHFGLPSF